MGGGGGRGLGNFPPKILAQQKLLKKIVQSSTFYFPGSVFRCNKLFHKLLPTKTKSYTT